MFHDSSETQDNTVENTTGTQENTGDNTTGTQEHKDNTCKNNTGTQDYTGNNPNTNHLNNMVHNIISFVFDFSSSHTHVYIQTIFKHF